MKYATSLNDKIEATPKAKGTCPCCGSDMVTKCGTQKVWHWAHKGNAYVTIGGKMKLNGIVIGRISFPRNGERWFTFLLMARNILLM